MPNLTQLLREQALALLQEAQKIDGLDPYALVLNHEHGIDVKIAWAKSLPNEESRAELFGIDLDDDDDDLDLGFDTGIDADYMRIESLVGLSVTSEENKDVDVVALVDALLERAGLPKYSDAVDINQQQSAPPRPRP